MPHTDRSFFQEEYGIEEEVLDQIKFLVRNKGEGVSTEKDHLAIIRRGFEDIPDGIGLEEAVRRELKVGLIVNDRNRPTPTNLVLEYLRDHRLDFFKIISGIHIATGSHSPPTDKEISEILGDTYRELKDRIHIHDAKDDSSHIYRGRTERGTEVYIDGSLDKYDYLLLINSVEPHYFAGFTGGRKSIIPGMASYETIERNHSYALEEGARTLSLSGNPIHEDMEEAAEFFLNDKEHLSVQLVQGPGKLLTKVTVGDIRSSFYRAVGYAKKEFCIPIKRKYPIVITIAKDPMGRNLYQAQKAMENGKLALEKGGVIILVFNGFDGIGPSKFWELLTKSDDAEEIIESISKKYVLGYHKAAKIINLVRDHTILAVTSIPNKELERGFIKGYKDLKTALADATGIVGDGEILAIPDGCVTVPMFKGEYI